MTISDSRITICQDREVVAFNIQERKYYVFPAIMENQMDVLLPTIFVKSIRSIDYVQKNVIPESLESRDGKGLCCQQ